MFYMQMENTSLKTLYEALQADENTSLRTLYNVLHADEKHFLKDVI